MDGFGTFSSVVGNPFPSVTSQVHGGDRCPRNPLQVLATLLWCPHISGTTTVSGVPPTGTFVQTE